MKYCTNCGGPLEPWYEYKLMAYDNDYPEGAPILMARVRCPSGHWFDVEVKAWEDGDFDF